MLIEIQLALSGSSPLLADGTVPESGARGPPRLVRSQALQPGREELAEPCAISTVTGPM